MLKAAETALRQLRRPEDVARARGTSISEVLPQAAYVEPVAEVVAPEPEAVSGEVAPNGESEADASS